MKDVTLIVTLERSTEATSEWARALASHPVFKNSPRITVYFDDPTDVITSAIEVLKPHASLQLQKPSSTEEPSEVASRFHRVYEHVKTKYFAIVSVSRHPSEQLETLTNQVAHGLARIGHLDLPTQTPLLLFTRQRRRIWVRTYIHYLLQMYPRPSTTLSDYTGFLAVSSGTHSLEAVDINADLEIQARSALGRFNLIDPPPWNLEIGIFEPTGPLVASSPVEFVHRMDSRGLRRWENLKARLPVAELRSGNYRLRLMLKTSTDALQTSRPLQPSPGLLASARTRALHRPGQTTFLLFHTVGSGNQTWVSIHQGPPSAAPRTWEKLLRRKDLSMLVKSRAGGRMRLLRLIRLITRPFMQRKNIWLIGERQDTAQDNGFHLFHHLRTHFPEREAYYVIEKRSPHWDRVKPLGNVIAHSSLRHRFFMLHAQVIANAYSIKHMTPRTWPSAAYVRHLAWRVGAMRIYLKHGIHLSTHLVKRGTGGYDLYLTATSEETASFRAHSGYTHQLVETGMPRYDSLVPTSMSRTILFMPTWRRYLVPKLFGNSSKSLVPFEGSTYQRFIQEFLNSERLQNILEENDFILRLLPHYNLRQELEGLSLNNRRITLADVEVTPFQTLLTECDVFITDYSSVQFDVAYVGTPIIYAQFDREEYERGHGNESWFDYDEHALGDVTYTLEQTLDALEKVLSEGCRRSEKYSQRAAATFRHIDQQNNARVVSAIDNLLRSYEQEISPRP